MQLASQMQRDGPELVDCSRQSDFANSDLKAASRYKFDCKPCDAIDNQKSTPTVSWQVARMERKVLNQFALRTRTHNP